MLRIDAQNHLRLVEKYDHSPHKMDFKTSQRLTGLPEKTGRYYRKTRLPKTTRIFANAKFHWALALALALAKHIHCGAFV